MTSIKIPEELKKVDEIFSSHGYKAYLVGGAVRDMILGKKGRLGLGNKRYTTASDVYF